MDNKNYQNVLIICGGQSPEHDVSIISARNIISHCEQDRSNFKFNILLVIITKSGKLCFVHNNANLKFIKDHESESQYIYSKYTKHCNLIYNGTNTILVTDDWSNYDHNNNNYHNNYHNNDNNNNDNCKIKIDIVFPLIHGKTGEDGVIQGFLEILQVPYIGSGVAASAACLDKCITKQVLLFHGIKVAPFFELTHESKNQYTYNEMLQMLSMYPHYYIEDNNIDNTQNFVLKSQSQSQLQSRSLSSLSTTTTTLQSSPSSLSLPHDAFLHNDKTKDKDIIVEEIIGNNSALFVKSANMGSSIGISKVTNEHQYKEAITNAFTYSEKVIIEKAIDAREIECAVLGNRSNVRTSCLGEIVINKAKHEFYTYNAKYIDTEDLDLVISPNFYNKNSNNNCNTNCNTNITTQITNDIQTISKKVFQILGCRHMARVDFLVDQNTNEIYFSEINTIPGFTAYSMYPLLWQHSDIPYVSLINKLIELAIEEHEHKVNML